MTAGLATGLRISLAAKGACSVENSASVRCSAKAPSQEFLELPRRRVLERQRFGCA